MFLFPLASLFIGSRGITMSVVEGELQIAGADKIGQTWTHVVAFFDVGHVGYVFEQQYFGVPCIHGLSQCHLD